MASPARAATVAVCLALSCAAHAADEVPERWLVAKAAGGAIGYDANSIERDAKTGVVAVTIALYTGETLTSPGGRDWQYMMSQDRLDCAGDKFQVSATLLYGPGQDMVELQDQGPQPWQTMTGNDVMEVIRDVVCKGRILDATREAATFEAAMTLMKDMAK